MPHFHNNYELYLHQITTKYDNKHIFHAYDAK